MLTRTAAFIAAVNQSGYTPILLVDIPGKETYWATQSVTVDGHTYQAAFAMEGLDPIQQGLNVDGSQRVGHTRLSVSNPALLSHTVGLRTMVNQRLNLKLWFAGLGDGDALPLFSGVADDWAYNFEAMGLYLEDGSFTLQHPLPAISSFGGATNPVDVIKYVIDNHMPLTTADAASFTTAASARSGWSFSGVIDADTPALPHLQQMARQCGCWLFEAVDGTLKMIAKDATASAVHAFSMANMELHTEDIGLAPLETIYTDFTVRYNRTPGTSTYSSSVTATPSGTSHPSIPLDLLCARAKSQYGLVKNELVFDADFISSESMALLVLERLVYEHTRRARRIRLTTSYKGAHLELTDPVQCTHALLPSGLNGVTFRVWERQTNPARASISYVLQEQAILGFNVLREPWEYAATRTVRLAEAWTYTPPVTRIAHLAEAWDQLAAMALDYEGVVPTAPASAAQAMALDYEGIVPQAPATETPALALDYEGIVPQAPATATQAFALTYEGIVP